MKKMVCEICGSQSIRKENGVFVCQECGTEYSTEEAKKLLCEIEEKPVSNYSTTKSDYSIDLAALKEQLLLWSKIVYFFEYIQKNIFEFEPLNESCWNVDYVNRMISYSNGRFYGPLDKEWEFDRYFENCDAAYKSINDLIDVLNGHKKKYEALFQTGRMTKDELDKTNQKFDDVIKSLNKISSVDYETSQSFWDKNIKKLLEEKFCFDEIREVTNSDPKLQSYLLNNKNDEKSYIDINKVDAYRYYDFLCRYYTRYSYGDKPQYIVEKKDFWGGVKTTYVPAFTSFNFDKLHKKIVDRFLSIEADYKDLYKTVVMSSLNEIRKVSLDYLETSIELEKEFYLPVKYRKTSYLIEMINMLETGKASSWKELINLFDTYLYRESVIESLEQIGNKLINIDARLGETNKQLMNINTNLSGINNKLSSLNTKMNAIVKSTDKICKYTNITMWSVV